MPGLTGFADIYWVEVSARTPLLKRLYAGLSPRKPRIADDNSVIRQCGLTGRQGTGLLSSSPGALPRTERGMDVIGRCDVIAAIVACRLTPWKVCDGSSPGCPG